LKPGGGKRTKLPNDRTRRTVEVSVISQFALFVRLLQFGDAFVGKQSLLVMLQFVDPNVLFETGRICYLLHHLADLADPFDYQPT
jgi:hypothetical protein